MEKAKVGLARPIEGERCKEKDMGGKGSRKTY
jgi:hypothetical protein